MNKLVGINSQLLIDDLKELHSQTGNANGSQRLAWTESWNNARKWLREKLSELPVEVTIDQAGNIWATLPGITDHTLIIGSHIDSVPDGGWLDGCLGVVAGLQILRRFANEPRQKVSIRLVAWAEEEGTQFGQSCFTSRATCGVFEPEDFRYLTDRDGNRLVDVIGQWGVDLDTARLASSQLNNAEAYLELHIEQGPILEKLNLPLAAVTGAFGIQRHAIQFKGQAAHAGSTPMEMRRDALAAAARFTLNIRNIAMKYEGVCTIGSLITHPGIMTAVVGQCDCTLDQRHLDQDILFTMLAKAREASQQIASEENVEVTWEKIYEVEPVHFSDQLINLCDDAIIEIVGNSKRMPSGPIHDAVVIARAGLPTAMMFVQSMAGLSHTKEEDTSDEHLLLGMRAFNLLVDKTIKWIDSRLTKNT